ncbi:MAG: hypothetical protein IIY21_18765 [Clostridiales bacterium]|nr:hypothetical protein [Clostridiales bacterium]
MSDKISKKLKDYGLGWNAIREDLGKDYPEDVEWLEEILKDAISWNWVLALAEDLKTQKGFERESNAINNAICISECSAKDFLNYIKEVYSK